jgi:hypothetical protein
MSKLLSKLINGSTGDSGSSSSSGPPPSHHLIVRPSPHDSKLMLVHSVDQNPEQAAPLYYITGSAEKQQLLHAGPAPPHPGSVVGSYTSSTWGLASTKISLRGQDLGVRARDLGSAWAVQSSQWGRLEWKPHPLTGTGLYLHDEDRGVKVAAFKSNGLAKAGEKQLLVFVPCDFYLVEMILLTALAAKQLKRSSDEAMGELAGAGAEAAVA